MKYIKTYETGEWDKHIDWDYVKNNPDDGSEEYSYIESIQRNLEMIINDLDDKNIMEIFNIIGHDLYIGAYAIVRIFDKKYKIFWTEYGNLWIENFPIDNTSQNDSRPGFEGDSYDVSDLLNDIYMIGGLDVYLNTKKYNL